MKKAATTVRAYLASLSADRRAVLEAVRKVVLANLDADCEEGMQYGMIGYYVPHRVYPAGYHCDPRQPLPFVGLASQKKHCALYVMCLYADEKRRRAFEAAWRKTGKKLDMGKACIRFTSIDDLAIDVLGAMLRRTSAQEYIAKYEANLPASKRGPRTKPVSRPSAHSRRITSAGQTTAKRGASRNRRKHKS